MREAYSGMMIAVMELVPQKDKRQALLEILRFVERNVRADPDCLGCGVFEAAEKNSRVLYLEQWRSAHGLKAHIRSDLYLCLLNAIDLAIEAPSIRFYEVSETKSMELIEALRT